MQSLRQIITSTPEAAAALAELEALPGVSVRSAVAIGSPEMTTTLIDARDGGHVVSVPIDPSALQLRWAASVIRREVADGARVRPDFRISSLAGENQPMSSGVLDAVGRLRAQGVTVVLGEDYNDCACVLKRPSPGAPGCVAVGPNTAHLHLRWVFGVVFEGKSADLLLDDDGAYYPRYAYLPTSADVESLGTARYKPRSSAEEARVHELAESMAHGISVAAVTP